MLLTLIFRVEQTLLSLHGRVALARTLVEIWSDEGEILDVLRHVLYIVPRYVLNLASPFLAILQAFKPLGLQNDHVVGLLQIVLVSLQPIQVKLGYGVLKRRKTFGDPDHLFVHAETQVE